MPEFKHLQSHVHKALRAWHLPTAAANSLLDFLLLAYVLEPGLNEHAPAHLRRLATNRVLQHGLELLAETNKSGASILKERFQDKQITQNIALKRNQAVSTIDRQQKEAIVALTEIIMAQEVQARSELIARLHSRLLPSTYSRLFGIEALAAELVAAVLDAGGPNVLLVTGIGGIGKTALVDAAARTVIEQLRFRQVTMIRVKSPALDGPRHDAYGDYQRVIFDLYCAVLLTEQPPPHAEQLAQLQHAFAHQPHLVIIDNLEDEATCALLVQQFQQWSPASRFVLTARVRPALPRAVAQIALGELTPQASFALLRYEANQRGTRALAAASDDELQAITAVVGGNPLALKLVVSLAYLMPVGSILDQLRDGRDTLVEHLYSQIYRLAWQTLSEEAKQLLEALVLASREGSTPERLCADAELTSAQFWIALQELSARSLVEVLGTAFERRYGIHQLTQTFLNTSIIGWK